MAVAYDPAVTVELHVRQGFEQKVSAPCAGGALDGDREISRIKAAFHADVNRGSGTHRRNA